jgi:hypothetical protein
MTGGRKLHTYRVTAQNGRHYRGFGSTGKRVTACIACARSQFEYCRAHRVAIERLKAAILANKPIPEADSITWGALDKATSKMHRTKAAAP